MRRTRNGNENAPAKRSWLRQSWNPLTIDSRSSGFAAQSGKRVKATLPASGGTATW